MDLIVSWTKINKQLNMTYDDVKSDMNEFARQTKDELQEIEESLKKS